MNHKRFLCNLFLAVIFAIILDSLILYIYLWMLQNYDSESSFIKIASVVASPELLAGITIAIPTIFTWVEENKKVNIEKLNSEYSVWLDKLINSDILMYSDYIHIKNILEKETMLVESKSSDVIIDKRMLFVAIQEKLSSQSKNFEFDELDNWKKFNNFILKKIIEQDGDINTLLFGKDTKNLIAIDFSDLDLVNSSNLNVDKKTFAFCNFNVDEFCKILKIGFKHVKIRESLLLGKDKVSQEDINRIKYELSNCGNEIELENFQYFNGLYYDSIKLDNDTEIIDKNYDIEVIETTVKDIYEVRHHGDEKLASDKFIDFKIFNIADSISIKNSIINYLNKEKDNNINSNNTYFSKSKNYALNTNNPKISNNWEWYSWNALTEDKAKDDKYQYYLFAVNIQDKEYAYILFNDEQFKEFINGAGLTTDNRYFFHFAQKKV